MQIPVITKTAYTDQGNKYTKSRIGKIAGTIGLGIVGNISANKTIKSPAFSESIRMSQQSLGEFAEMMGNAFEPANVQEITKKLGKYTKTVTIATMAITGLALGAVVDFAINGISKFAANKKANQNK